MIRQPRFAGSFYQKNVRFLLDSIEDSFKSSMGFGEIPELSTSKLKKSNLTGILVPHAGYIYSGAVASNAFANLAIDGFPETFVIICPNHTGLGDPVSIFSEGEWITPLGHILVDEEFSNILIDNSKFATSNFEAHLNEHSIEVELPFLQYFSNNFNIVPICMGLQNLESTHDIVNAIIDTQKTTGRNIRIIASSDLSHFYPQDLAKSYDNLILNDIKNMDSKKLFDDVKSNNITMCGYSPAMVAMDYSKIKGEGISTVLKYTTSGEITHDFNSVVGYSSVLFK
jgi:AmmeMemoRadiSam system protein B